MSIDIDKLFDKHLDIITNETDRIHIEKKKIYINDFSEFYGEKYIVTSDKFNKKNLYILKEIYSLDNNRLRYLYERYTNVLLVDTIEKKEDGSEERVTVIEYYDDKKSLIGSIGNINRIDSDKLNEVYNSKHNKILKLILKPKREKAKDQLAA